jgi:DMSO reductase family type II enzyme chaperone
MSTTTGDAASLTNGYLALAQIFSYPNPGAWQRLTERGLVDPSLAQKDLETQYLAAFEVGQGRAAVPLFEGMHRGDLGREGILEDLLRFYEYFGVRLNESNLEYPDHLVTELEFVAWLCLQAQAAEREGRDAAPFRRAARDFLDRHLAAWLPTFRRKLEATGTAYVEYATVLGELVEHHRRQLEN